MKNAFNGLISRLDGGAEEGISGLEGIPVEYWKIKKQRE